MSHQKFGAVNVSEWVDKSFSLLKSDLGYHCFFDTVTPVDEQRWSFLFKIDSQKIWPYPSGDVMVWDDHIDDALQNTLGKGINDHKTNGNDVGLEIPFKGGHLLFLGYEYANQIEPTLSLPINGMMKGFPFVVLARCKQAFAYDHSEKTMYLVAEENQGFIELKNDWIEAKNEERSLCDVIDIVEEKPERYINAVNEILHLIKQGDVFQVNLSRAWDAVLKSGEALSLYRQLREANPAPMATFWRFDDNNCLLSSSPERLVSVKKRIVETRPIAGTSPRSTDKKTDEALAKKLLNHFKERAEHIMLIDLERNDLGRIADVGSIKVNKLMELESYAHVHHIASNIQGKVRSDVSPKDIIHAVFPGGTITGCPKVQCMKIIGELEAAGRGPYTGSLGYINNDGSMDMNILIRTIALQGSRINFRAGAGIVYDSDPQRELRETQYKAEGMLRALQ